MKNILRSRLDGAEEVDLGSSVIRTPIAASIALAIAAIGGQKSYGEPEPYRNPAPPNPALNVQAPPGPTVSAGTYLS
jgi:hypothetical protein